LVDNSRAVVVMEVRSPLLASINMRIEHFKQVEDARPHSRGAKRARVLRGDRPLSSKRAQGMPGEGLTHGPRAVKKARGRNHRFSRIIRHSLRDGVTAYT
jgi:hypothetical protein